MYGGIGVDRFTLSPVSIKGNRDSKDLLNTDRADTFTEVHKNRWSYSGTNVYRSDIGRLIQYLPIL
jgi:hypothetical protein